MVWLGPVAVLVSLLLLLRWGLTRDVQTLPSALVGKPAPQFNLATLYVPADSLALADLEGRVTLVNFWASWCIPCVREHPVLTHVTETWGQDSVALVGILFQDSPENGKRFMEQYGGDWPLLTDNGSTTAISYGMYGVPETFFIGADGVVASRHAGAVTWDLVKSTVDSLLRARRDFGSQ